jgi:hypothetical protein
MRLVARVTRFLHLSQYPTEVVGLRSLQRRELRIRLKFLLPQLLTEWQHVPVVEISGTWGAKCAAKAHHRLLPLDSGSLLEGMSQWLDLECVGNIFYQIASDSSNAVTFKIIRNGKIVDKKPNIVVRLLDVARRYLRRTYCRICLCALSRCGARFFQAAASSMATPRPATWRSAAAARPAASSVLLDVTLFSRSRETAFPKCRFRPRMERKFHLFRKHVPCLHRT